MGHEGPLTEVKNVDLSCRIGIALLIMMEAQLPLLVELVGQRAFQISGSLREEVRETDGNRHILEFWNTSECVGPPSDLQNGSISIRLKSRPICVWH